MSVAADTNIDFTLPPGWLLSGRVTDSNGAGLDSIQVDIRDFYSGQKIFVSNGETDTLGNYSIAVPGGTLTSRFTPPPGSRLVAVQNDSIFIDSDLTWNQLMRDGILVNCTVTDSSGVPISGVDFDFTDESTGIRAFTPFDQSNSGGRIIASLAPDTYTVRVDPPPGSLYDRLTITGLPLMNDTSLSFMLPEVQRILFSGRIVNRLGLGIPGIDINLRSSITGLGVPLSNNITDTLGSFETAVPIGLFDVSFSPPRGSRYVAFRIPGIQFSIDTVWSETVLDTGVIFSAQVFDLAGLPLANVDFDFIFETNGQDIYTPHDNTDNAGTVDVTVPAGIYTIELTPTGNSGFQAKILTGFNITGDTAITIVMTNAGQASPSDFMLKQNFPNPFNDRTSIAYTLLKGSEVKIYIYNAIGQRVIVIDKGYQEAGYYLASWNGRDSNGGSVASGLYFYRLKTSSGSESKKMLFLK